MEAAATNDHMERAAKNQALCREVNERIEALHDNFDVAFALREFICECADTSCTASVRMTVAEYESVRSNPAHFAILPLEEHVFPEVEDVVARDQRYWVVRKLGTASKVVARLDPRAR